MDDTITATDDVLVTTNDIAERIGRSPATVRKWRERYPRESAYPFPVPVEFVNGNPRYRLADVERWIEDTATVRTPGRPRKN